MPGSDVTYLNSSHSGCKPNNLTITGRLQETSPHKKKTLAGAEQKREKNYNITNVQKINRRQVQHPERHISALWLRSSRSISLDLHEAVKTTNLHRRPAYRSPISFTHACASYKSLHANLSLVYALAQLLNNIKSSS